MNIRRIPLEKIEVPPYEDVNLSIVPNLARSIKYAGQHQPVLLTKRNGQFILIEGVARMAALKSLGRKTARAIVRQDVTEEQALAIRELQSWTTLVKFVSTEQSKHRRKVKKTRK